MPSSRIVALAAGASAIVLVALIVHASLEMSLASGLRAIVSTRWGMTTLVDLYLGLAVVGAWIAYRERSALRAAPWIVALALLGNLATAAYVVIAALRSGTPHELLLGRRR